MHHTTSIRSWGNITLGAIFAAGTGYALFEDVLRHSAPITTDHVMTALVLVGTIAAGHLFFPTAAARKVLLALGLAILFAAGTFICVVGSAGRVAEVSSSKEAEANKLNGSREDAVEQLKKARADRADLAAKFAKECGSGKGTRCDGTKASIEYADSHIAILQVRVDNAKPEQQANVTLKHAGKVFELFLPYSAKQIEAALVLLWPFAKALMLEVATIVFLGLGLGHTKVAKGTVAGTVPATVTGPVTVPDTVNPAVEVLRNARKPLSNDELAALMQVSKAQASRLVARAADQIRKERAGRKVQLSLR